MLAVATAAPSNMIRDSSDSKEPPKGDGEADESKEAGRRPDARLTAVFFCLRGVFIALGKGLGLMDPQTKSKDGANLADIRILY